jgi:bleomycin hydrolase
MIVNIVEKYGLIPNSLMPCTFNRVNSRYMNYVLAYKLREGAAAIRELHGKGKPLSALRALKQAYLREIYRILAIHLGEPPEKIDWAFKPEKKGGGKKGGKKKASKSDPLTRWNNITPKQFYQKAVGIDPRDIKVLISAPMEGMRWERTYTVEYFNNMVEGQPQVSLNLPPKDLKKLAVKILQAGEAVLFGCEVRLDMHGKEGLLGADLYDYGLVFDTTFGLDKGQRLDYHQARMTHAMVFTGVDLVKGKPVKWKVENSCC